MAPKHKHFQFFREFLNNNTREKFMYIFLFAWIFPKTFYFYTFRKMNSQILNVEKRDQHLYLLSLNMHFFFFSTKLLKILSVLDNNPIIESSHQSEETQGHLLSTIFTRKYFFQFAKMSKICQIINFQQKYHL